MKTVIFVLSVVFVGMADPISEWNGFEISVRDQSITKDSARKAFPYLCEALREYGAKYDFARHTKWLFPVKGYSIKHVGKGGFRPNIRYGSSPIKGYDFYDGNLHGGHPAYDIFIHDKDMDCLDDHTHKSVAILAPVDLLVLSTYETWEKNSQIRGGNYIWAISLPSDELLYFAHMDTIVVQAGYFCEAGSVLGTVGRSGKNAYPARSHTHLHLMVLKIAGDRLIPIDYWDRLRK